MGMSFTAVLTPYIELEGSVTEERIEKYDSEGKIHPNNIVFHPITGERLMERIIQEKKSITGYDVIDTLYDVYGDDVYDELSPIPESNSTIIFPNSGNSYSKYINEDGNEVTRVLITPEEAKNKFMVEYKEYILYLEKVFKNIKIEYGIISYWS